jgi:hypothetical protein
MTFGHGPECNRAYGEARRPAADVPAVAEQHVQTTAPAPTPGDAGKEEAQ